MLCTGWRAGVNITFNVFSCSSLLCFAAEEQVHEEVAKGRRGLQRAGGRGGLPGLTVCGICSSAASCDAGSLNRGSCSHKVTDIHEVKDLYIVFQRYLLKLAGYPVSSDSSCLVTLLCTLRGLTV